MLKLGMPVSGKQAADCSAVSSSAVHRFRAILVAVCACIETNLRCVAVAPNHPVAVALFLSFLSFICDFQPL